jgi:hypothetical protein
VSLHFSKNRGRRDLPAYSAKRYAKSSKKGAKLYSKKTHQVGVECGLQI